jgi:hypothetical protein
MGEKSIKTYQYLKELFEDEQILKITVPSYQRAYSWEQKQLAQFIGDLNEMTLGDKKGYYFGHFIFENEDEIFNVIDGQQRLTTFILFLIACQEQQKSTSQNAIISKFCTVDYDEELFSRIKNNQPKEHSQVQKTLSIARIEDALEYFKNQFETGNLKFDKIEQYISVLKDAHISTHITEDKAVAVQIFELHNSRGVKLNTIEKVKAKLMKAIYLNTNMDQVEFLIKNIQDAFGRIYHFEETTRLNSFRGNLELDEILLIHLRMIDDGTKIINPETKHAFNKPSKSGNREENILSYIDDNIQSIEKSQIANYIVNLVQKFEESVEFIVVELPKLDITNPIIGDTIILEKNYSLSFFILLNHLNSLDIKDGKLLKTWEKLLFTRDFHDKYKGLQYRDDFELLFFRIVNENGSIFEIVKYDLEHGFRSDYLDNDLQRVVKEYAENNKNKIIQFAFNWHKEKMIYLLYKYEISLQDDCRKELREIMKNGVSVEHILPQEWKWEWTIYEDNNSSNEAQLFLDKIEKIKNGIGNLLIITPSQNSALSNNQPKDKEYKSNLGLSYQKHNESNMWDDCTNWESNILTRGAEIYSFLVEFIQK